MQNLPTHLQLYMIDLLINATTTDPLYAINAGLVCKETLKSWNIACTKRPDLVLYKKQRQLHMLRHACSNIDAIPNLTDYVQVLTLDKKQYTLNKTRIDFRRQRLLTMNSYKNLHFCREPNSKECLTFEYTANLDSSKYGTMRCNKYDLWCGFYNDSETETVRLGLVLGQLSDYYIDIPPKSFRPFLDNGYPFPVSRMATFSSRLIVSNKPHNNVYMVGLMLNCYSIRHTVCNENYKWETPNVMISRIYITSRHHMMRHIAANKIKYDPENVLYLPRICALDAHANRNSIIDRVIAFFKSFLMK